MTIVWLAAAAVLLVAGTVAAGSVPRVDLRFEERVLAGFVATVLAGTALTFLLSLVAGLGVATVLGGNAIAAAAFAAAAIAGRAGARERWVSEWRDLVAPEGHRHLASMGAVLVASAVLLGIVFAHSLATDGEGNLQAGFQTVWADWAQHLTTMSSFTAAHNLPPHNPLFSGQTLRYPFLPDFESATLVTLGLSPPAALALPGGVLAVVVTMLIVLVAVRLGAGLGAAVLAAGICLIGGGLGFTGILADSCLHHGFSAQQCTWGGLASSPGSWLTVVTGTLHDLPGVIAAQPRAYDGLLTATAQQPLPDQQWYTPLFAWWLPQRTILYGFSAAMVVLVLVHAAAREKRRAYETFAVCGLLLGLMPLVHIHTLIAMTIVLAVMAAWWRRRGWLVMAAVAAVVAAPQLVTVLSGPHGTVSAGNAFPTVEPGWIGVAAAQARAGVSPGSLAGGVVQLAGALLTPQWWGFWVGNTVAAVPMCAVLALGMASQRLNGRFGSVARRLLAPFPEDVRRVALASGAVFLVANLVVFQSWDWDNTKLFAYWYLGAALLMAVLTTHWWGTRRHVRALLLSGTALLTGILVLLRLLPWTPAQDSVGGPYTSASVQDVRLAGEVGTATAPESVFLTEGRPNDPVLMLAGRASVMGYYGWLWSYGTDFGTRVEDVRSMLEGCGSEPRSACDVFALLRRYGVSYAEIDDRINDPGVLDSRVGLGWWQAQHFPVVARDDHITVYDVRGA